MPEPAARWPRYVEQGYRVVAIEANLELVRHFQDKVSSIARTFGNTSPDRQIVVLHRAIAAKGHGQSRFCLDGKSETNRIVGEQARCRNAVNVTSVACDYLVEELWSKYGTAALLKVHITQPLPSQVLSLSCDYVCVLIRCRYYPR